MAAVLDYFGKSGGFWHESPSCKYQKNGHPFGVAVSSVRERGLDSTMERASSSRRPAGAQWASALRWVRVSRLSKKETPLKGCLFFGAREGTRTPTA